VSALWSTMMMRTVAALSLALVGHAYVLPAHQARCVLPAQQARASRRLVVGMSDPLKDDMSDPEAKGFAYDALAPLYGESRATANKLRIGGIRIVVMRSS